VPERILTVAQARELDRDAVERLGIPSVLLMENAARGVAQEARVLGEAFVILCGPGNNGGDGLAAARHLGRSGRVFLLQEPAAQRSPDAALQLRVLRNAGWRIDAGAAPDPSLSGVWIDALFGTGLTRALDGAAAQWVDVFNRARGPKLAVDVPSGLDGDTGEALGPTCRCDVTVTFEAKKRGLVQPVAAAFTGRVVVVPLGLPAPG
jgi:NAD(P)H-hydrate epimerase